MKADQTINISTRTFVKAVFIVLSLWFLWFIREVVAIFIASIMLASLIDPFADWFEKKRIPRGLAVLIVYTFLIAVMAMIFILMIPIVAQQIVQLLSNLSGSYSDVAEYLGRFQAFSEAHGFSENINSSLQAVQQSITSWVSSLFTTVKGFFGSIAALAIVLVLTFYMVVEEESMRKYFKGIAPAEYKPFIAQLLNKMQKKIGAWLRGQIILGVFVGSLVYIGLKFLGVEYALLLALIAAIFEIIPYVGPVFSLIPAVIIGFAQSPMIGVGVVILYLIIQQIENNLLVPKIMQKVTGLNPVVSIAALLVGIKVGGVVGAILAIPLATMIVVAIEDVFKE